MLAETEWGRMEGTSRLPWALARLHGEVQGPHSPAMFSVQTVVGLGQQVEKHRCAAVKPLVDSPVPAGWSLAGWCFARKWGGRRMVDRETVWARRV